MLSHQELIINKTRQQGEINGDKTRSGSAVHGSDGNQWKVSAMLVYTNESEIPEVKFSSSSVFKWQHHSNHGTTISGSQWRVIRYDMSIAQSTHHKK